MSTFSDTKIKNKETRIKKITKKEMEKKNQWYLLDIVLFGSKKKVKGFEDQEVLIRE